MAATGNGPRARITPERWQQIKGLLAEALAVETAERPAFLIRVCGEDSALQSEVESLLAAGQSSASDLLNDSAPTPEFDLFSEVASNRVGQRLGPYRIVEEIGAGGMGEVYRAFRADDHYHKEVAIKLVRAGQGSKVVIDRFKNERQVLAGLDHPNIARLVDGGTSDDGVPYFVMELVDGRPIDEYCDTKKLSTADRLKLFLHVCSAVQYAHQRLIIHRDLKPGNILVTSEGVPKLLDFGIAKILAADDSQSPESTLSILRPLTPRYASPEQITGGAITTASDVYSLGVLLYELLTGHRPYRMSGQGPQDIERAVCESVPERPSAVLWRSETITGDNSIAITAESVSAVRDGSPEKLTKNLRGDLDNIVLMSLRKEPQRRYASAEQFAEDIRRHLQNLPVHACPDTFRYRTSKFVRRHKAGVIAAAVVVITVFSALAATMHEARVARQQQLRAEQRFNDVRELANSLMFEVHDSIQDLPGSTPARKILVGRALQYLDRLSRDASSDSSLQRELGTAYEKVGTVQGNPFGANLGDIQGALESYRKSLAIREVLVKSNPASVDDQVALARSQRLFAATLANGAESRDEQVNLQNELVALATAEKAYQAAPTNAAVLEELQSNYDLLFTLKHWMGDYAGALDLMQKEQPIIEARLRANSKDRGVQFALAKAEAKSGQELGKLGRRKEGLEHSHRAIQMFETLAADGKDANVIRYLALANDRLGDLLLMNGDIHAALQADQTQVSILNALLTRDPANAVVQLDLATALAKLGNATALAGQSQAGLVLLGRSAAMLQEQIHRDPSYTEPQWSLNWALLWTGEILEKNGNAELALTNYRKVLAMWSPNGPFDRTIIAGIHLKLASVLAKTKKHEEARTEYDQARTMAEQILSDHPYMLDAHYIVADVYSGLGELSATLASDREQSARVQAQGWAEAQAWFREGLDTWDRIQNPGVRTPVGFACGNPKKVAENLARCDRALRNLSRVGKE